MARLKAKRKQQTKSVGSETTKLIRKTRLKGKEAQGATLVARSSKETVARPRTWIKTSHNTELEQAQLDSTSR